jgi:hypothetical protein
MKRRCWALAALLFPLFGAPSSDYLSAKRKFDLIEGEKLRPGSRVTLTSRELNAYIAGEVPTYAPQGVRNTQITLGDDSATGTALIDFLKLRQASGEAPGWLMSKLLAGERPVLVTARIQSAGGRAQVDVQHVEISGVTLDGATLDYLIQNFLIPQFPEAKVGRKFDLEHHIDHLEVKREAVGVVVGQ